MRILVVEDEKRLAASLQAGLQAEGFAVDTAHDGEEGLWYAREHDYDAILLDIMLPVEDGLSICRAVRAFAAVPILMITARVEEIDRLLGLELGADDYICKPFSPREVVARVKAVLRRVGGNAAARQRLRGVRDPARGGELDPDPHAHRPRR